MDYAFRTNISVIGQLAGLVKEEVIKAFVAKILHFKRTIRRAVVPESGIIKGDTLKDSYFPSTLF